MGRLKNKIALITGGCGDIGFATAEIFVREGARVIIADIRDTEGMKLQEQLGVSYVHLDVGVEVQWEKFVIDFKKQHGCLDILFNNAGIFGFNEMFSPQNPEFMSLDDWHTIHTANLDGVFLGCKYGLSLMKKQGGSIINMSSRAAFIGVPSAAAYASSKAAICNYTKSVALYCAEKAYHIRCNSIHPGIIRTRFWDPILKTQQYTIEQMQASVPMGDLGSAYDVACAVLFLASEESRYLTGTELTVDGGMSSGRIENPIQAENFKNLSTFSVDKAVGKG